MREANKGDWKMKKYRVVFKNMNLMPVIVESEMIPVFLPELSHKEPS